MKALPTIACVLKSGGDFNPEHVMALKAGVEAYLPGARFICLTDMNVPCERVPLKHGWPGWWSKMELFRPDIVADDILFFDLDTILAGDLSEMAAQDRLTIMRDVYRPKFLQSSVMYLPKAERGPIWREFAPRASAHMAAHRRHGDQGFLERFWLQSAARWQDVLPGQVVSFKADCAEGVPPDARAIVFHGKPRPWETDLWIGAPETAPETAAFPPKGFRIENGLLWPAADKECIRFIFESLKDLDDVVKLSGRRRVAVQAGGNCGVWASKLAGLFQRVITFEPDPANFRCLVHNTAAAGNVTAFPAALGEEPGWCDLRGQATNIGAHTVAAGSRLPVMSVDDLMLDACDLIYLDIEGSEPLAVKGAWETIKLFHPVIAIEDKGLSEAFGYARGAVEEMLAPLGYQVVARPNRDVVLVWRG